MFQGGAQPKNPLIASSEWALKPSLFGFSDSIPITRHGTQEGHYMSIPRQWDKTLHRYTYIEVST
jgi:hypothetical protein